MQKPGDCICKPGFGGRRCDICAPGYRNHPKCEPCPCNRAGSLNFDTCEEEHCICKTNVEGLYCDRCKVSFRSFQPFPYLFLLLKLIHSNYRYSPICIIWSIRHIIQLTEKQMIRLLGSDLNSEPSILNYFRSCFLKWFMSVCGKFILKMIICLFIVLLLLIIISNNYLCLK